MTPEATSEILKQFEASWDKTEQFYTFLLSQHENWDSVTQILEFIRERRNKGEHRHFRLGTSVYFLIISRSVSHGLRDDQKRIKIMPSGGKFDIIFQQGTTVFREYTLLSLDDPRLDNLLKTLKDTLVD